MFIVKLLIIFYYKVTELTKLSSYSSFVILLSDTTVNDSSWSIVLNETNCYHLQNYIQLQNCLGFKLTNLTYQLTEGNLKFYNAINS